MTDDGWGTPENLTDLDDSGAAEGVDPGAGGRSGATRGDLDDDDSGGAQDAGTTPGGGLGVPDIGASGSAPAAPDGSAGALTPNDDLVGGDPEERLAGGRQLPQATNRAGEREDRDEPGSGS